MWLGETFMITENCPFVFWKIINNLKTEVDDYSTNGLLKATDRFK